jgi:zinc transporter 1/2/3
MNATIEMKCVAAVLVFLAGVAGGAFARQLGKSESGKWAARLANAFAGGVFLGAALMHMLPDARNNLESVFPDMEYPYYTLVAAVGFLLVLLLDKGVTLPRSNSGSVYPYLLALVLSVHSVITGIALGLESSLIGATAILIAVLAHKSTAAMALGISFNRERIDTQLSRNLLWMFYTTTPIGILLGTWWSVFLEGRTAILTEALFDALAAGTFLYIAVVDILVEELKGSHLRRLFLPTLLGFTVMAVIAVWA